MANIALLCDDTMIGYNNGDRPHCRDSSGNNAWIEVDPETLGQGVFPPLTYQEGFEISGGIVALWALGVAARMAIQTITRTRYM